MGKELRIKEGKLQSFRDLVAWQKAHRLVLATYKVTQGFSKEELYGLTSQMRRAVISIVSNIAEGFSRASYREKSQFYSVALGSVVELQAQLEIAKDLGYLSLQTYEELIDQSIEVHKLINGLIKGSRKRY